jgi:hypothetical protein
MADEKSPEQVQQELFDLAQVPPSPEPEPPPALEPTPPAEPSAPPPPVEPTPEPGVPTWRLREEAEARRAAEDRARILEARFNEVQTHLKQQEKQPDFFENPNQATEAIVQRYMASLSAEQQRRADAQEARDMYNSKMIARLSHGGERVDAAEQAFMNARNMGSLDPADYERVVTSPNRWDAVVQWHTKESVTAKVGNDPEAWYKQRREADMDDPVFQAEVLKRMQKGAASRPSETRLPPSLSRTTAAAGNTEKAGDGSNDSLFRYAMSNGRER